MALTVTRSYGPESQPPGVRERKRAATAVHIHEAAVRLVAEHGYEAVTVAQIAEAADVSPKTVFNYWGSKEGAVVGITELALAPEWIAAYLAPENHDPFTPLVDFLASWVERQSQEHSRRVMKAIQSHPRLMETRLVHVHAVTETMNSHCAQKLRRLRPDEPDEALLPEARLITSVALTIARHAWQEWASSDTPGPFRDHLAHSLALHKRLCQDFMAMRESHAAPEGTP